MLLRTGSTSSSALGHPARAAVHVQRATRVARSRASGPHRGRRGECTGRARLRQADGGDPIAASRRAAAQRATPTRQRAWAFRQKPPKALMQDFGLLYSAITPPSSGRARPARQSSPTLRAPWTRFIIIDLFVIRSFLLHLLYLYTLATSWCRHSSFLPGALNLPRATVGRGRQRDRYGTMLLRAGQHYAAPLTRAGQRGNPTKDQRATDAPERASRISTSKL